MADGEYVFPVYLDHHQHTVLVLDGVEEYRRLPTPEYFATVDLGGLALGSQIAVLLVAEPVGREEYSAVQMLAEKLPLYDSVVLWAKNTETYNSIRDELRAAAAGQWDGTPFAWDRASSTRH